MYQAPSCLYIDSRYLVISWTERVDQFSVRMGVKETLICPRFFGSRSASFASAIIFSGAGQIALYPVILQITAPHQAMRQLSIDVVKREFPHEAIEGVPENTVNPPPEIAARTRPPSRAMIFLATSAFSTGHSRN